MARKRSDGYKPSQRTKPKKGDPVEIPVPSKRDVFRDLTKVVKGKKKDR